MNQTMFYLLASCVYILCIALRFYYPFILESYPQYFYQGAFLLNTHDGYFYAQGAKDSLQILRNLTAIDSLSNLESFKSTFHSPIYEPLSLLTAFLALLLPLTLEQLFFFLPGFLGSLIVFPVMVAMKKFGILPCVLSGLISGIGISYYNRTMFGYYDTDMLIVSLAFCVGILALQAKKHFHYALF